MSSSPSPVPMILDDEALLSEFNDTLFSSLSQNSFQFPVPRELTHVGINADIIQPGLIQLQPAFDSYSGTLETLQEIPVRQTNEHVGHLAPGTFVFSGNPLQNITQQQLQSLTNGAADGNLQDLTLQQEMVPNSLEDAITCLRQESNQGHNIQPQQISLQQQQQQQQQQMLQQQTLQQQQSLQEQQQLQQQSNVVAGNPHGMSGLNDGLATTGNTITIPLLQQGGDNTVTLNNILAATMQQHQQSMNTEQSQQVVTLQVGVPPDNNG